MSGISNETSVAMNLSLIVATTLKGGIGHENALPWPHNTEDMQWFRKHTKGKTVVMGRKTWESLPTKPLPGRINIVISSSSVPGAHVCLSLKQGVPHLLTQLRDISDDREVVVIGGGRLYTALFPYVNKVYFSRIYGNYACDTYFHINDLLTDHKFIWKLVEHQYTDDASFHVYEKTDRLNSRPVF